MFQITYENTYREGSSGVQYVSKLKHTAVFHPIIYGNLTPDILSEAPRNAYPLKNIELVALFN